MTTKAAINTKTLLTVKVDKQLKARAQKTAEGIGLPLGTVVNGFLRQFVQEQAMTFSIPEIPNASLQKTLKETERDIAARKNLSSKFSDVDDAIAYLRSHR
ncbi:MAG: type II toxin-antitoxin system RelB/DinJ family antitoxin [Patescibacteria group bacterium]